ncbi:MAG: Rieske (2Fe-2S) protein [Chloroflexi bacterium]|nr:Rieske (2Fe-2S) protein [Chloroflexota bacterium]
METRTRLHPLSSKGLPAYPNGWYALAFTAELPPGSVLTRAFMGQDVVLFRTRSGVVSVIDPYCPHLGAHLGYASTVEGETIRCPFHYFCFDVNGVCVSTGYGTKPPPKAVVRAWPVREQNGLILVWYHAEGRVPDWDVPPLDAGGYSPLVWRAWELNSHPQETTENSVDIGHLSIVHHYDDVQMLSDLTCAGPCLTVRYAMFRPAPFAGLVRGTRSQFTIHVYGLGYSLVEVEIPRFNIQARLFVLPTPIDVERITLRIAVSTRIVRRPREVHPLLGLLPAGLTAPLLNRILPGAVLNGLAHDVQQDFEIWQHKVYFSPPILAEGDGPVGRYRYWAKQFYSDPMPPALE